MTSSSSPPPADTVHVPVMPTEVLAGLQLRPGQTIVDATLGGAGHAQLIAAQIGPTGLLIGLDRDPAAVARAQPLEWPCRFRAFASSYVELGEVLRELELATVDGIVMDLGLSSDQLADASRGFSFRVDGPLDLRFNPAHGQPAARLIAQWSEKELADVIYRYGEERFSRRIARRIVAQRERTPIETAEQLAELVRSCFPPRRTGGRQRPALDPATRTFQALRIAVNDELRHLETSLQAFPEYLLPGGRLVAISFHSLEDRLVKQAFRDDERWEVVTRKPLVAGEEELQHNPRARSAKLRVAARRDPATGSSGVGRRNRYPREQ